MVICLNVINPTNLTNVTDLTSDFRENSNSLNLIQHYWQTVPSVLNLNFITYSQFRLSHVLNNFIWTSIRYRQIYKKE